MSNVKRTVSVFFVLLLLCTLIVQGLSFAGGETALAATAIKSAKFPTPAHTLTKKGATKQLKLTTSPAGIANSKFKWKSSNSKIVAVNQKGKITARAGSGKATITATSKTNKKIVAKLTVYVGKKVTKLTLKSSASVTQGKTITLKATAAPASAAYKKVTWKSADKKIATVNSKGVVTGVKAGKVKITATAGDGSGKKVSCTVTVKKPKSTPAASAEPTLKVKDIKLNSAYFNHAPNGLITSVNISYDITLDSPYPADVEIKETVSTTDYVYAGKYGDSRTVKSSGGFIRRSTKVYCILMGGGSSVAGSPTTFKVECGGKVLNVRLPIRAGGFTGGYPYYTS